MCFFISGDPPYCTVDPFWTSILSPMGPFLEGLAHKDSKENTRRIVCFLTAEDSSPSKMLPSPFRSLWKDILLHLLPETQKITPRKTSLQQNNTFFSTLVILRDYFLAALPASGKNKFQVNTSEAKLCHGLICILFNSFKFIISKNN